MISVMPMVQTPNDDTDDGAAMNGGRRPTIVAAPVSTSPELSARPRRRTFTAKDKLRILADIDSATYTGATGAILRREGLYSSTLSDGRRQPDAGALGSLSPGKRGSKTATPNPLTTEVILLQRTNARVTQTLARAEAIIDIQQKVAALLGMPLTSKDDAF
jgi:transposase